MPHHDRESRRRLSPRHRPDHDVSSARRRRRPPRRRHLRGCGDPALLRLAARQADLSRPNLRRRRRAHAARARRVPRAGVATNLAFLQAIMAEPDLAAGTLTTAFLADHPGLADTRSGLDRGTRILTYLADVTVEPSERTRADLARSGVQSCRHSPTATFPHGISPAARATRADCFCPCAARPRDARCHRHHAARRAPVAPRDETSHVRHGRRRSVARARASRHALLRGVGWRDLRRGAAISQGRPVGATRRTARRNTQRLSCRCCCAVATRWATRPTPIKWRNAFVHEAATSGIDIFRIFDAFNNIDQMRPAIEAVLETDKIAEGTLCYSGDLANPEEQLYTLDYYLRLAEQLVETGCHVLCVKDMAGLLRAPAAKQARRRAARTFRFPGPSSHARHVGWTARDLPRRHRSRCRCRRRGRRPALGNDEPAAALGDCRRDRSHGALDGPFARGAQRP